ncbi:hypothetical protein PIB30_107140, partial [Stylosanthes scabra]|nr:hypothetical protein [Stylosanthes scabra]
ARISSSFVVLHHLPPQTYPDHKVSCYAKCALKCAISHSRDPIRIAKCLGHYRQFCKINCMVGDNYKECLQ